jgi:hypothetical protein
VAEAVSMIYFRRCRGLNLAAAGKALRAYGFAVRRLTGPLVKGQLGVRPDNDPDYPELRIAYAHGKYVRVEAASSGEKSPYAAEMAECDARFEILIDDLDEVLDELNTLMEVQWELEDLTRCFTVNSWNGNVSGPDE